jgi:hypothetical protein
MANRPSLTHSGWEYRVILSKRFDCFHAENGKNTGVYFTDRSYRTDFDPLRSDPQPMSDAIVPWFVSANCYEQFRSTATDADVFFDSHSEWIDAAMEHERLAEQAGVIIIRIRMHFEDFEAWRLQHGLLNHADTRLQYAELVAQKLLGSS